jgi:hypothetical protein
LIRAEPLGLARKSKTARELEPAGS